MTMKYSKDLKKSIVLNKNANQNVIIDQYRILVESINKTNEIRESSNNFWVTVNSLGISAIAYIRDNQNLTGPQKPMIMWVLVFLGLVLCFSWLSYLSTIKQTLDFRNTILLAIEKYLPLPVFQILLQQTGRNENRNSLTIREMFVPISFVLGYLFFAVLLIFFSAQI